MVEYNNINKVNVLLFIFPLKNNLNIIEKGTVTYWSIKVNIFSEFKKIGEHTLSVCPYGICNL